MTEPDPLAEQPPPDPAADNRRNHYRVLHVQPEAPVEVIKASWRTLMGQLRQHPDLGGSHAQAAIVNEAWAVLSDPHQRAAYDRHLRQHTEAARGADLSDSPAAPGVRAVPGLVMVPAVPEGVDTAAARPPRLCPLCGHGAPLRLRADSRCTRCNAPLAALPEPGREGHELLGRRDAVRRDQSHVATLHLGWPSAPLPVRWRDLSLTGLSFYAPTPMAVGQRVHLIDSALEAVAEVVGSRPQGRVHTVHARVLSALLLQATGVFVSAQA